MQKAETNTVDAKQEAAKPNIAKLIDISVDETKRVYVNWPADKKELCIIALAEAIKLVETYLPPKIIQPTRPNFISGVRDFVTGRKS